MLERLLKHLYGTMVYKWPVKELYGGEFKVENGSINLPFLLENQYFRIVGSVFNDGVYQYPVNGLFDETFHGAIWTLNVSPSLVELAERIEKWEKENADKTPYQAESFGGYSYTAKTGANGRAYSWKDEFAADLATWRKL